MDLRLAAREIFLEALRSVDLRSTMRRRVRAADSLLHVGQATYDLHQFAQIFVVALGKAAVPMAEIFLDVLIPHLQPRNLLRGVVIGTTLPVRPDPRVRFQLGAHPLPDETSLHAAAEILHLLRESTEDTLVIFLISGGASAMVELPLDPAISLYDLIEFHKGLVHSGLSIGAMNTLRKHVSATKGGRLAEAAYPATLCTLLVSDVPPSRPDIIASGPTFPDPSTLLQCRELLAEGLLRTDVPISIRNMLLNPHTPETPKPGHFAFEHARFSTLLSSDDLARAADRAARARGFHTVIDHKPDEWPFAEASKYLLDRLSMLARTHPDENLCLISAGEIAVPLRTANPGLGGRNQHFALHTAMQIAHVLHPLAVLSGGSDGIDGSSPAAGAVADATTLERAVRCKLDAGEALAGFDSYPLFEALGDAIVTGPTGNNLRDLRLLLTTSLR